MDLEKFKKAMFEKEISPVPNEPGVVSLVNMVNYKENEYDHPDVKRQKDMISLICDILYEYDKMKSNLD